MFKRYWWILLVMLPIGMFFGFLLAALASYLMPKKYESFATIEVKPQNRMISSRGDVPGSNGDMMSPQFFGTEFEKIKSRGSLAKVIDSLDLTAKWNMDRERVMQILKGIINTQNIRGTDLISVTVRHTNREDARDITAEVARAYKEYRSELEANALQAGYEDLKKGATEQESRVEEKRKILTKIASSGALTPLQDEAKTEIDSQDFVDAKREFETDQALLEKIKIKLASLEIEKTITGDSIIIHDDPIIADSPVSPNLTLNLIVGAVGGLFLSPFLALPLMWILSRKKAETVGAQAL